MFLYIYTGHSCMLKSALQMELTLFFLLWLCSEGGCGLWQTTSNDGSGDNTFIVAQTGSYGVRMRERGDVTDQSGGKALCCL